MAPSATQSVGAVAEQLARSYLQSQGLRFVNQNFRCRFGEIDLIMLDASCLVIVEVRYRATNRFATAALSIGAAKQRKIVHTAAMFLGRNKRYANVPLRFDVVAIDKEGNDDKQIHWLRDAFRPDY